MTARVDPLESTLARWGAASFLVVILGTEIVTMLVGVATWRADGSGAIWQLVVYVAGIAVGIYLWVRCPRRAPAAGLLRWFLSLALALWALQCARALITDGSYSLVSLTVPLLILMVWAKPPTRTEAAATVTGIALVFAGASVVALALEVLGVNESWYVVRGFTELPPVDQRLYWLPLAGPLGLEGRWAGPFPHPNMAGPVGGLLIVVGMCRRGWVRGILLVAGFGILVLTASRTATIGALLGTAAVAGAAVVWDRHRSLREWLAVTAVPVLLGILLLCSVLTTTSAATGGSSASDLAAQVGSASGRSEIWPRYVRLWLESPWTGVPDARIQAVQDSGELPGWAHHAHNLLLDTLVRLGVVGGLLLMAALVVAGLLAARAAAARVPAGLGIIGVVLGCAVTEALVFWQVWAVSTIIVFLGVIASVGDYPPARLRATESTAAPTAPEASRSAAA